MSTETQNIPPLADEKTIFKGSNTPHSDIKKLPAPPPWRSFDDTSRKERGSKHCASAQEVAAVNAALYLRRPLLITGRPGTGKTSLAYAVQQELKLDDVLVWPITSRSVLKDGLYHYDAIARLQDASLPKPPGTSKDEAPDIGRYLRLGPVGAALCCSKRGRPRVLLIDEIDKSDIDLPNDLLHIFEEGEFEIPELARLPDDARHRVVEVGLPKGGGTMKIERGRVRCEEFPIVFLTSNGERDFPPAFLRRCVRLDIPPPDDKVLAKIVKERLGVDAEADTELARQVAKLIARFYKDREEGRQQLATDQLLNAVKLLKDGLMNAEHPFLKRYVMRDLSDTTA